MRGRTLREVGWLGAIVIWWACQVVAFDLPSDKALTMAEFQTRGSREDGSPQWEVRGRQAVVRGALAELSSVEVLLHLRDGDTARITSPQCSFDQSTQVGASKAPLHVEGKAFSLDGLGYDVRVKEHKLHVRQAVRMLIRGTAELLKTVPGEHARGSEVAPDVKIGGGRK